MVNLSAPCHFAWWERGAKLFTQCVFPSFPRKVKSLLGTGNTEFMEKALTGGATALAAAGGNLILPQSAAPAGAAPAAAQTSMPREAPGLGWSPLAEQEGAGHPRSLGVPHSARGEAQSPGTAQGLPRTVFNKALGGERRFPAQGAARSFPPSAVWHGG